MQLFGLRPRKITRTCLDCGESWTLDASLAHMHASRRRGPGISLAVGAAGRDVAMDMAAESGEQFDQELETERQLRTCPKCGSDHFKDRRA
jgi:Zn finger protein HypA/HybF involved in hydrogenase expression